MCIYIFILIYRCIYIYMSKSQRWFRFVWLTCKTHFVYNSVEALHTPPKTNTEQNLKLPPSKRKNIYKPPIFGFYVSFRGCSFQGGYHVFLENPPSLWSSKIPTKCSVLRPGPPKLRGFFYVETSLDSSQRGGMLVKSDGMGFYVDVVVFYLLYVVFVLLYLL